MVANQGMRKRQLSAIPQIDALLFPSHYSLTSSMVVSGVNVAVVPSGALGKTDLVNGVLTALLTPD